MTRVIWNTPLGAYTHFTLGEIRAMKTHGEKRVRAILEVFHAFTSWWPTWVRRSTSWCASSPA